MEKMNLNNGDSVIKLTRDDLVNMLGAIDKASESKKDQQPVEVVTFGQVTGYGCVPVEKDDGSGIHVDLDNGIYSTISAINSSIAADLNSFPIKDLYTAEGFRLIANLAIQSISLPVENYALAASNIFAIVNNNLNYAAQKNTSVESEGMFYLDPREVYEKVVSACSPDAIAQDFMNHGYINADMLEQTIMFSSNVLAEYVYNEYRLQLSEYMTCFPGFKKEEVKFINNILTSLISSAMISVGFEVANCIDTILNISGQIIDLVNRKGPNLSVSMHPTPNTEALNGILDDDDDDGDSCFPFNLPEGILEIKKF